MSEPLKVLFLGNHTVGVRTLQVLQRDARIVGAVAHPDDPEDGVRYESVFVEAGRLGVPVVRMAGRNPGLADFVRSCAPDLIWITDYRYIIGADIIALAPLGAVNLHPSILPAYRGRASINWAILRGETRLGLSAHFVDVGMDTGDAIAHRAYDLAQNEDVGDALNHLYPLYETLTAEVLGYFRAGQVPRLVQDHTQATAFPRRTADDGRVDWTRPAREVWNLIRAVAAPYPGAFTAWGDSRLFLWKVSGIERFAARTHPSPGTVLALSADRRSLTVACGDAALVITSYTAGETGSAMLSQGAVLGEPVLLEASA